ncbi:MAG TPA: fibronectin type III domain-containing protein [Terriglobales bacterium]|nr:fibronectin type III domain-containing protein [Terriglobales bacterium]
MKHLLVLLSAVGMMALGTPTYAQVAGAQSLPAGAQEQITNGPVAEMVSDSSCRLGWSSRAAGNMSVQYGPERGQMSQKAEAQDSADGRNHHVELTGLQPNTRYFFQVMRDGQPVGGVGTFRTVGSGDPPEKSKAIIPQ